MIVKVFFKYFFVILIPSFGVLALILFFEGESATTAGLLIVLFTLLWILAFIIHRKDARAKRFIKSLIDILRISSYNTQGLEEKSWYRALKIIYILSYFPLPYFVL